MIQKMLRNEFLVEIACYMDNNLHFLHSEEKSVCFSGVFLYSFATFSLQIDLRH